METRAIKCFLLSCLSFGVLLWFEAAGITLASDADAPASHSEAASTAAVPIHGVLESLGVFKNGVLVVRERYHVPTSGLFRVTAPPFPVHGTFFIQSDVPIETRSREEKIDVPVSSEKIDWTTDFCGRWLSVVLPGEKEPRVVRVMQQSDDSGENESVDVDVPFSNLISSRYNMARTDVSSLNKSVLLQCENGETIWLADSSLVSSVTLKDEVPTTVSRIKPVLIFDVKDVDPDHGATFYLSYLTRQASWAPQYRVLLKDEKELEIEQSAILINDWRDFSAEETFLYSGFPQIALKNTLSPLSPGIDLQQFFNSLNQSSNSGQTRDSAYMTQAIISNVVSPRDFGGEPALPTLAEESSGNGGVDIYSQSVGAKALRKGERVLFSIDKKSTDYKRIVRWDIFDSRDYNGRVNSSPDAATTSYGRTTTGQTDGSTFTEPWDVVVFRNPFSFPITTGPASIYSNKTFLGQNTLYWRNPGEKTFLPVTKALGVRVNSSENERVFDSSLAGRELRFGSDYTPSLHPQAWGNVVIINSNRFRCAVIDASIELVNQRNEEVEIQICRRVTGIPISESFEGFDEKPEIVRRTDFRPYYYYYANPHSEATWTTTLKPMEKRVLKFSYQVLVLL